MMFVFQSKENTHMTPFITRFDVVGYGLETLTKREELLWAFLDWAWSHSKTSHLKHVAEWKLYHYYNEKIG
jgi:hypothetical protein